MSMIANVLFASRGSRHAAMRMLAGLLLFLAPPGVAPAQAYRCADVDTGRALYTGQPCGGGALVVPERSVEQKRADADRALDARERQLQRRETALQLRQDRLQREQDKLARAQAEQAAADAACRAARESAAAIAGSGASLERQRSARASAALACGQPPAEEQARIVHGVVPIWIRRPQPMWHRGHAHGKWRPHGPWGQRQQRLPGSRF